MRQFNKDAGGVKGHQYAAEIHSDLCSSVPSVCFRSSRGCAPPNDACDLPKDLQREVASKYPGKRVVTWPTSGLTTEDSFKQITTTVVLVWSRLTSSVMASRL